MAYTWTQNSTFTPDTGNEETIASIRCSSNGQHAVYACDWTTGLWVTHDAGVTFTDITPTPGNNDVFKCCAISDDGQTILTGMFYQGGVGFGGPAYLSTNGGTSWSTTAGGIGNREWYSCDMSSDGQIMYFTTQNQGGGIRYVYKSTNGGSSWAIAGDVPATRSWMEIRCSSDGVHVVAGCWGSQGLYYSHNTGANWTLALGGEGVANVCISDDGTIMYAGFLSTAIKRSIDSGANWTTHNTGNWATPSCTTDGEKVFTGYYRSTDRGDNWIANEQPVGGKSDVSSDFAYLWTMGNLDANSDAHPVWGYEPQVPPVIPIIGGPFPCFRTSHVIGYS